MENNEIYKNLLTLLKLFKNRPYHLAKYLIDNNSLNKTFIKKVLNSDKLNEISNKENFILNFNNIEKMEQFYVSLIDGDDMMNKSEEIDLKSELNKLIQDEKYEEAANLRDYIINKNIKKSKNK
jgi:hypothetical protein